MSKLRDRYEQHIHKVNSALTAIFALLSFTYFVIAAMSHGLNRAIDLVTAAILIICAGVIGYFGKKLL